MRNTPASLVEKPKAILVCPVDPVTGNVFTTFDRGPATPMKALMEMEPGHKMPITSDSRTSDSIRKTFLDHSIRANGEIVLRTMGNIGADAQIMAYKVPIGSYYQPLRDWLFQALDDMDSDAPYFLEFKSYDAIQLTFYMAEEWQAQRGALARISATYEGRMLTLRAFKPDATINQFEYDKLLKLKAKAEKLRAKAERQVSTPRRAELDGRWRPYHSMVVGESMSMNHSEFTNLNTLRVVIYNYGSRSGKRFQINKTETGATITRVE